MKFGSRIFLAQLSAWVSLLWFLVLSGALMIFMQVSGFGVDIGRCRPSPSATSDVLGRWEGRETDIL